MGAGITMAAGLNRVEPGRRQVAFLGDSTFFHSGITGLINAVCNRADITVVILDNRTTAMTGHQPHPGMGRTALGEDTAGVDLAGLVRACGVEYVRVADPFDLEAAGEAARSAMSRSGPSVVIMRRDCAALVKKDRPYSISSDQCVNCGACVENLGCPAIGRLDDLPVINANCAGCGVCSRICPAQAIRRIGNET
jgi:indolepyruvate ferredoxin oxidoreductase alpha subunit